MSFILSLPSVQIRCSVLYLMLALYQFEIVLRFSNSTDIEKPINLEEKKFHQTAQNHLVLIFLCAEAHKCFFFLFGLLGYKTASSKNCVCVCVNHVRASIHTCASNWDFSFNFFFFRLESFKIQPRWKKTGICFALANVKISIWKANAKWTATKEANSIVFLFLICIDSFGRQNPTRRWHMFRSFNTKYGIFWVFASLTQIYNGACLVVARFAI